MADLSTEQVSYEQALLNLLAAYGVGEGSGTIEANRLSLISAVKAKLDEIIPEGEGVQFAVDGDTNVSDPMNLLINAILDEAAKRVLLNAPKHYLSPVRSTETAKPIIPDNKTGYIVLPDNFLRFISLKMAEWKRPVTELIYTESEEYLMQFNPYARGGIAKPKAAITYKPVSDLVTTEEIVTTVSKFGYLYNQHAVLDPKNIAPAGWHVATAAEYETLITTLAPDEGWKMREQDNKYWQSLPALNTNSSGFSARGTGYRIGFAAYNGAFKEIRERCYEWTSTALWSFITSNGSSNAIVSVEDYATQGYSVRWLKDDSTNPGTVTGNDGKVYETVKIGNQVWTKVPVAETKFRNGDTIPLVTLGADWAEYPTAARCAYDNDESNVMETTSRTTTTGAESGAYEIKRVLEYFSIENSHTIDWLFYVQETAAQDLQSNLTDALTWMAAGMVLQITERTDLARAAFEQEQASYLKL